MPAAAYIRVFLACVFGILVGVAIFNIVIDPYGVSRIVDIAWLNSIKPAASSQARIRKPLDVWRKRYDGIALGTSQVEHGIDPQNPSLVARGIALYNFGMSEERPFEQALLLRDAAELDHIKFAIVSLDFLRYVGGGGKPEFLPKDWTRWTGLLNYLKSLLSGSALRDSLLTMSASWRRVPALQHLPDGMLNVEAYFTAIGYPDYRQLFDSVDAAYLNGAYLPMLDERDRLERAGFDHTAVREMLSAARRYGVALHFFFPPSHARQAEIVRFLGLDDLFKKWVDEIACQLATEASERPNQQAFELWDFSGYNSVTTEAIPPRGAKARMRWYQDSVHFSPQTGNAIVDRILEFPAGRLSAETFGEQVSPANIRNHFRKREEARDRYLTAYPEVQREILSLHSAGRRVAQASPPAMSQLKECEGSATRNPGVHNTSAAAPVRAGVR